MVEDIPNEALDEMSDSDNPNRRWVVRVLEDKILLFGYYNVPLTEWPLLKLPCSLVGLLELPT